MATTGDRAPSVIIAGAGLAGLTLAQSLLGQDWHVAVYERDATDGARGQGNRITLDRTGLRALERSLPPHLNKAVLDTSGPPGGSFRFTNADLRDAFVMRFPAEPGSERQVDRAVLRRILLDGLDHHVHFGHAVTSVHARPGHVDVLTAGGTSARADLVVVADGIGSRLRGQVLAGTEPVDTGVGAIYGRSSLQLGSQAILPDEFVDSGVLALLDEPGAAFFMTAMRFLQRPCDAFPRNGLTVVAPEVEDYVMWGLVLTPAQLRAATATSSSAAPRTALLELAARSVRGAHPLIRGLVRTCDPASVLLSRFAAGTRPGPVGPSRVAVLGDAVHPMPPFGAHGGNTALRDANSLSQHLAAATACGFPLGEAVAGYHAEMAAYAFDAVDAAMNQMRRLGTTSRTQRWVLQHLLPSLHRRVVPRDLDPFDVRVADGRPRAST